MNHTGGNNYAYDSYHGQLFHSSSENISIINTINTLYLDELTNIVNPFKSQPSLVTANPALPPCCSYHKLLTPLSPPTDNLLRNPFPPGLDDITGKTYSFRFTFAANSEHSLFQCCKVNSPFKILQ